jgi:site-specific recombinase XerD
VNKIRDLYVVQRVLGHTNYRSTQRYAHLSRDTLGDAAEAVADILREIDER